MTRLGSEKQKSAWWSVFCFDITLECVSTMVLAGHLCSHNRHTYSKTRLLLGMLRKLNSSLYSFFERAGVQNSLREISFDFLFQWTPPRNQLSFNKILPSPPATSFSWKLIYCNRATLKFSSCKFHQILHSEDRFQNCWRTESQKACLQGIISKHFSKRLEMEKHFLIACKPYSYRSSNGNKIVLHMSETARNTNELIRTCREANSIRVNFAC